MRIAVFSSKPYDKTYFQRANTAGYDIVFYDEALRAENTALAAGCQAICIFVNDTANREVLQLLAQHGVKIIALRCAGFNNVDLVAAKEFGLQVVNVPAYSPHAVAELTVGLAMMLNRKLHVAYKRVREGNFALDGLLGFDFHGKTVGIVGTGRIGAIAARIFHGFGCAIVACDINENPAIRVLGGRYASMSEVIAQSDIISLHVPLNKQTHHLINAQTISQMKKGLMLINTSRGGLIDTQAAIDGLKNGQLGSLGLDVYEKEADLFFADLSNTVIRDDVFARLLTFPNVVITGHQGFFTHEALVAISQTTLKNISQINNGDYCENELAHR
jgi:D-lactate dehydrogenase